jgi:cytochrome P450
MNESMRLYPPVPVVGRRAQKDDEADGYSITNNADVAVNIAGIHRHPDYWPDANEFIPARFENYDVKGSNRFVFMPFGGGPRLCIGNNFAMMEMQIINAMLASRADMTLESYNIKPIALITLKPENGVMMKLNHVRTKQNVPQMEAVS